MRAEWTVTPHKGSRTRDGWLTHLSVSPAEMVQSHQMDESLIAAPKGHSTPGPGLIPLEL